MTIDIQKPLENNFVSLVPLYEGDFELLYEVACNPKVWEQHPNKDRWKRDVFHTFFQGAMESGGAYRIVEKSGGKTIGSTRFYGHDPEDSSIMIGYTFYGPEYWGKGYNPAVKIMMMDYIFQFVTKVFFHVGAVNKRSQIAIERLGAVKVDEKDIEYFGEKAAVNFVYCIEREDFLSRPRPQNN